MHLSRNNQAIEILLSFYDCFSNRTVRNTNTRITCQTDEIKSQFLCFLECFNSCLSAFSNHMSFFQHICFQVNGFQVASNGSTNKFFQLFNWFLTSRQSLNHWMIAVKSIQQNHVTAKRYGKFSICQITK